MAAYDYVIVGGGMCADSAVRGIRELAPEASIAVLGSDPESPYNRPPLSKKLWKGGALESIWRHTEQLGVELRLGWHAERLDLAAKRVVNALGEEVGFGKLLLATGGTPRRLKVTCNDVVYYRTVGDYRRVRALCEQGERFAVIGGGFIGWEMAAALAMNHKQVVMIMPDEGIGARVFSKDLARFLCDYYREKGVEVLTGRMVVDVECRPGHHALLVRELESGSEETVEADAVVAGIGIRPNTDLAEQAGLRVDNGVVVDEFLATSHPDIYAAGDVAGFFNPALGTRIRVEHEDNANTMGRYAGRNMAGAHEPYHHLPMFYSDLFDLGFEAVGDTRSQLNLVAEWKEPFRKGVVYYLQEKRVRGVLLWNVWEKVDEARQLIAQPGPFEPMDLKGRLLQE